MCTTQKEHIQLMNLINSIHFGRSFSAFRLRSGLIAEQVNPIYCMYSHILLGGRCSGTLWEHTCTHPASGDAPTDGDNSSLSVGD